MPIKNCLICDIEMGECHPNTKYCDQCKILRRKELRKYHHKISKNKALIEIDTTGEEFKPIEEHEDYYEISNCGRVWSKRSNKFLKLNINTNGYSQICLHKNGKRKFFLVHRLVALHFIENPTNYKMIDHIDRVKTNNHFTNLRWTTYKINNNNKFSVVNRTGHIYEANKGNKKFQVRYYNKDLTNKKTYYKCFYTEEEAKEFWNNHLSN